MWSSISSYLYDESTDGFVGSKASQNRVLSTGRIVAGIKSGNRGDAGRINAAAAWGRDGRGETYNKTSPANHLQTSLHSTSSNNSNSKCHVNKPAASDNTTIVRGIIVGEEQSGKTCLIRRLRGEDPFQSRGEGHSDDRHNNRNRGEKKSLMALIPWTLPEEALFQQKHYAADSEELVQLYISEGKSFCYSNKEKSFQKQWRSVVQTQNRKECNFIVWMVDPRMDHVLDIIQEGLNILFPSTIRDDSGNDNEEKPQNTKQPLIQSLCILLNFRDINPSQEKESQKSLVDQVRCIVAEVVGCHNNYHQKPIQSPTTYTISTPAILVYESSMKNCYGLKNLHSFITLPYLSHREREMRRRAEQARQQHAQWKQGLMESKVVEYSKFVEQRPGEQERPTKQSLERKNLEEEKEQLQLHLMKQNELLRSNIETEDSVKEDASSISANQDGVAAVTPSLKSSSNQLEERVKRETSPTPLNDDTGKRILFAKSPFTPVVKKPSPASAVTEHNNLESFFSDDEEEDDLGEAETNSIGNYSSDSSNDGDFYIDVSGTRCSHANAVSISQRPAFTKKGSNKFQIEKISDSNICPEVEGGNVEKESIAYPGNKNEIDTKKKDLSAEHSSRLELDGQKKTNDKSCEVHQSVATDKCEVEREVDDVTIDEPTSTNSRDAKGDTNIDAQPNMRSLKTSEEPDALISVEEPRQKSLSGDNRDGIPDEPTTKQLSFMGNELKEDNQKGNGNNKAEETLSDKTDMVVTETGDKSDAMPDCDIVEPNTCSVNNPEESDTVISVEEVNSSDDAVTHSTELSFSGHDGDGESNEPTSEQSRRDNSSETPNTKWRQGARLLLPMTTNPEDIQKSEYIKKNLQHQKVMDSNDESTGPRVEFTHDRKREKSAESDGSGEELTVDDSIAAARQSHESLGQKSKMPMQSNHIAGIDSTSANSASVSNAALAAIEAAKREAEKMAQTQSNTRSCTKREEKKKKKKDGDKKKKKKKDKRPKD